jgi:hypothetical protein
LERKLRNHIFKVKRFVDKCDTWTSDVSRADVCSDDLENKTLDIRIRDSLDVTIPDFLVPDLERFAPNAVQDREEAALKGILEHF